MNYTAKNLEDIAKVFSGFAENCDKRSDKAGSKLEQITRKTEAQVWREAAYILRNTKMEAES